MVICVKCMKKQSRRSESVCPYDGNDKADPIHAWMDYEIFINEVREKLFPFIRERIEELQGKYAEKQTLFNERMVPLCKRLEELQAEYAVYLNEGLPCDVGKKKQQMMRQFLRNAISMAIGLAIGVFIALKWIIPMIQVENDPLIKLLVIAGIVVVMLVLLGKPLVKLLKDKRYAGSQEFADELAHIWRKNKGYYEAESNIEAEKNEWSNTSGSFERVIYSMKNALVGSDKDLLECYDMDRHTKNIYLEKIYEGAW